MRGGYKNKLYTNPVMDTEAMIAFQYDVKELAEAEKIMNDIIDDINIEGYSSTDKVVSSKIKTLSSKLSSVVGFNVSLTYNAGYNFCTYIVPAKINDALLNNINEVSDYYEHTKSDGSVSEEYYKKNDTIDSMLSKSYQVLDKVLNTKGITVDFNKGKIFGLDNEYHQIIMVDFNYVLDTYKLTARECLACIMHEIGHTFTYYSQLDNTYANMNVLLDTIKEEYLVRNSSARETITIAYKRVSNSTKDIDNKNITEVILDLGRMILIPELETNNKEAETQSDLFAARYGFGEDLTTSLLKMTGSRLRSKSLISNIGALLISIISVCIWIYLIIISVILMSSLILYPIGYLMLIYGTMLFEAVMNSDIATTNWGNSDFNRYDSGDYDSMYDRVNRIRQQIIASLKTVDLDKKHIRVIISQLDGLAKITEALKHKKPITAKLKSLFGSKRISKLDMHYVAEALLNNDLMIASARLKSI